MNEEKAVVTSVCIFGKREGEIRLVEQTCVGGWEHLRPVGREGGRDHDEDNDHYGGTRRRNTTTMT
jgi:hypothetical protein